MEYRTAYLWIVPASVDGTWTLREDGGAGTTVNLTQTFQKISGDVMNGAASQPLVGATLRGDQLRFAFNDAKGVTRTFNGTVRGNELGRHAEVRKHGDQGHRLGAGRAASRHLGRDAAAVRPLLRQVGAATPSGPEPRLGGALHMEGCAR